MTIDDVEQSLRTKLEQLLGNEEASRLMDRPPGGRRDLVTNQTLDLKVDALRSEMRSDMTELRAELKTEMTELRADLKTDMAGLSASVDRRLRAHTWVHTSTLIAGLALAATLGRIG